MKLSTISHGPAVSSSSQVIKYHKPFLKILGSLPGFRDKFFGAEQCLTNEHKLGQPEQLLNGLCGEFAFVDYCS